MKSFLSGPPLSLIESLPLTSANFSIAYKTLVDRYQNKRNLGCFYLNKICSFLPLTSNLLEGLQSFFDCFHTNISALKSVNIEDPFDFILLFLALRALDSETRKQFESQYELNQEPKFTELLLFIQKQCHVLEISRESSSRQSKPHFSLAKPAHVPTALNIRFSRSALLSTSEMSPKKNQCRQAAG